MPKGACQINGNTSNKPKFAVFRMTHWVHLEMERQHS